MVRSRQTAAALRDDIEESLAYRIPKALTPCIRLGPERKASGIEAVDGVLGGGLPVGAITELFGAEGSGRTTMALTYVATTLQAGGVAAWVDVDDMLDPVSAAMCGVDLERLLWVRCGAVQAKEAAEPDADVRRAEAVPAPANASPAYRGSGGSPHPRSEGRGMDRAIQDLLVAQPRSGALPRSRRKSAIATPSAPNRILPYRSADREEQVAPDRLPSRRAEQFASVTAAIPGRGQLYRMGKAQPTRPRLAKVTYRAKHEWTALDQALRAMDLILQSSGFGLVVLDLGSTPVEMAWRIPLASWFRFRAACERTRSSLLLLTRYPCARSSAELTVRMQPGRLQTEGSVLTGMAYRSEIERVRFQQMDSHVLPIRKPPQSAQAGAWKGRAAWTI